MTKEFATVTIPGFYDESFEVPRGDTRAWDPSHSLYLEVRVCTGHGAVTAGNGGIFLCF